jgi:signal transduction histidine kinase
MTTDEQQQIELLQQQLHNQEKMASLGMLSAGIAHEIQNPLNFVINFSKMSEKLLDDLMDIVDECREKLGDDDAEEITEISEDLKENLSKIEEHGQRAINIIRSILLQSRGKDDEYYATDICELVHEYVWLSYHAMRANDKSFNIAIKEEYPQNMTKKMVVPQDLCRAVLNVVNNACYTVKEKEASTTDSDYQPAINVKVVDGEKDFSIVVADNGMGMNDEVRSKLFDTFFTTKPVGKGTGLGMSITNDIITKKHKGKILVDTIPGEGTTFTFVIPNSLKK